MLSTRKIIILYLGSQYLRGERERVGAISHSLVLIFALLSLTEAILMNDETNGHDMIKWCYGCDSNRGSSE